MGKAIAAHPVFGFVGGGLSVQRAYIAPQKAYIAKRDTHTAAYSVTRVSRACNDRQKAAIARLARKANVFRGSGAAADQGGGG